mmetsp:Transcript_14259/g.29178  ORF Transcript_14259/g.29178 Transcript_14259/m.29178 type:complete len:150 (+) Transcript_14259:554-1003(+)
MHCRHFASSYEVVATKLASKGIHVGKIDGDRYRFLVRRFRAEGFPTFLRFEDGRVWSFTGTRSVDALERFATEGMDGKQLPSGPLGPMSPYWKFSVELIEFGSVLISKLKSDHRAALAMVALGLGALSLLFVVIALCIHVTTNPRLKRD